MKSSLRGGIVVVAICSWFAISNHCVFAALATNDTAPRECPFHSKPAKQEKPSTGAQCCKILRAVASVPVKGWARDDTNLSDSDGYGGERALAGEAVANVAEDDAAERPHHVSGSEHAEGGEKRSDAVVGREEVLGED